ncbi:hypothetical protein C8A00DRAFT_39095, partial [Chaetomidium leptoderma]
YCGKKCQTAHWSTHKVICKSSFSKPNWRPTWDREGRDPAWAIGDARNNLHNPFGKGVYMWGNVPAIDILRLPDNEGLTHDEEIELLFAASGDLRNVVKTIVDLPTAATQHINVTVNDREFAVVARNAILLLFALNAPETATGDDNGSYDTADALIRLWYSAFIPMKVLSVIQDVVKPLIADICTKIASKDPATSLGKTWKCPSGRSLRLVLKRDQWFMLERMVSNAHNLSYERASEIRHAVTLAPDRADYRDRWDFKESTPSTRIAKHRFREDGLLLPFGHPRVGFDTPNITLFQDANTWLMDDKANPLDGWPIWEVLHQSWGAKEDWYGKLYAYLHHVLGRFLERLATSSVSFEMHCLDARELKNHLGRDQYTRIEASNISDLCHLGIQETLTSRLPLLQRPQRNPHATIITLFINGVMEAANMSGADMKSYATKAMRYLPTTDIAAFMKPNGAAMTRIWDARSMFFDVDKFFKLYKSHRNFDRISSDLQIVEKEHNTIIEKWPTQLKLQSGQKGAQEEFDVMMGSNLSGIERYVEWKKFA